MSSIALVEKAGGYLHRLCVDVPSRSVGSPGNQASTAFFAETVASFGFGSKCREFDCIEWTHGNVCLAVGDEPFEAFGSPYSLGCETSALLAVVSSVEALATSEVTDKILLLQGEIAAEQLMPKNFQFYNPDHHKRIVGMLENKAPRAIVAATSRDPHMAGAIYPFPLIEDGDFDIPSVYMTQEEGRRLARYEGQEVFLEFRAERLPGKGYNVVARKGSDFGRRVVVCAHIDAKKGTPGALDNATGVVVLLLLAELLQDYAGRLGLEIVALNGEDYYSAPGEMLYLQDNEGKFDEIVLAINMDGAGYRRGNTAYSLYDCPPEIAGAIQGVFSAQEGMIEGQPWYQSDHAIFVQQQRPALAITSDRFDELWAHVAHTAWDTPEIVDPEKLVNIAQALRKLLLDLDGIGS